jgi:hypothetical protein
MVILFIKCRKRKPRKSSTRPWFPNEDGVQEENPGGVQDEVPSGSQEVARCQFRCLNYGELGHRKNSPKCNLNETRKRQDSSFMLIISIFLVYLI